MQSLCSAWGRVPAHLPFHLSLASGPVSKEAPLNSYDLETSFLENILGDKAAIRLSLSLGSLAKTMLPSARGQKETTQAKPSQA